MTDAPANRQYVACKFRIGDTRLFTYHTDGVTYADGDVVRVPDRSGDGWNKVFVVSTSDAKPSFPTKPIIGLYTEEKALPLETAATKAAADEAARCKAGGLYNIVNGVCTTCERPEAECGCLPF